VAGNVFYDVALTKSKIVCVDVDDRLGAFFLLVAA